MTVLPLVVIALVLKIIPHHSVIQAFHKYMYCHTKILHSKKCSFLLVSNLKVYEYFPQTFLLVLKLLEWVT